MTSPARKAALLRLLEDWEAGRMTPFDYVVACARNFSLVMQDVAQAGDEFTLTPTGLTAARALRDACHD